MNIKIINKEQNRVYPYLGIDPDNFVVLFIAKNSGIAINTTNKMYSDSWDEKVFRVFQGEIVMSNF